jgi:predicted neuraminidase
MITAFNDSVSGRDNLTLAVSADEGRSWKRFAVIEKESGASFSYPYLMRTSDGLIHLAYTWKSKTIRSATFTEGWIAEQEAKQ